MPGLHSLTALEPGGRHFQNAGRRWVTEVEMPEWGSRLALAVRKLFDDRRARGLAADVDDVVVSTDDQQGALIVQYRRGGAALGLLYPLDLPPPVGSDQEESDLAVWLARWIVDIELLEPLGDRESQTRLDAQGVRWRLVAAEPPSRSSAEFEL